jgi:hypothetical protein
MLPGLPRGRPLGPDSRAGLPEVPGALEKDDGDTPLLPTDFPVLLYKGAGTGSGRCPDSKGRTDT